MSRQTLDYARSPKRSPLTRSMVLSGVVVALLVMLIIWEPTVYSWQLQVDQMSGSRRTRCTWLGIASSAWQIQTSGFEKELNKRGIALKPQWVFVSEAETKIFGNTIRGCSPGLPWMHLIPDLDLPSLKNEEIQQIQAASAAGNDVLVESLLKKVMDRELGDPASQPAMAQ